MSNRPEVTPMMLKTPDGSEFEVYVAGPDDAPHSILILHDWWGVLDYNKQWADRLAQLGYRAMVVDLYEGERARTPEEAGEMMRGLNQDMADSKLVTAVDYLSRGDGKVATLGWSLGGRQAMQAALLDAEDVVAIVLFYCRMVTDPAQLQQLGGPVLVFYAQQEQTWPAKMDNFANAMASAGKSVESFVYDAAHGFANPNSERFNPIATDDAWHKTCEFLARVLR